MKLNNLRGAIRKMKGNPIVDMPVASGAGGTLRLYLMKGPLLEELEKTYPEGGTQETGWTIDDKTLVMSREQPEFPAMIAAPVSQSDIVVTYRSVELPDLTSDNGPADQTPSEELLDL